LRKAITNSSSKDREVSTREVLTGGVIMIIRRIIFLSLMMAIVSCKPDETGRRGNFSRVASITIGSIPEVGGIEVVNAMIIVKTTDSEKKHVFTKIDKTWSIKLLKDTEYTLIVSLFNHKDQLLAGTRNNDSFCPHVKKKFSKDEEDLKVNICRAQLDQVKVDIGWEVGDSSNRDYPTIQIELSRLIGRNYYLLEDGKSCQEGDDSASRIKTWKDKIEFKADGWIRWGNKCNAEGTNLNYRKRDFSFSEDLSAMTYYGQIYQYYPQPPSL